MTDRPPLPSVRDCCLFLDVDGTLLNFAATPDAVHVDEKLRMLLRSLDRACNGALALVSGRPIADLDRLFEPLYLAAAGVHGCERRDANGHWLRPAFRGESFGDFRHYLRTAVAPLTGVLFEDKMCAIALHYRQAPQLERAVRTIVERLTPKLPTTHEVIEGEEVIEIKPSSFDKGSAIEAFMQESPFAGRHPIFIGDDLTDQDGFATVRRHGGMAIAVGSNVHAEWHLDNPFEVKRWLADFASRKLAA